MRQKPAEWSDRLFRIRNPAQAYPENRLALSSLLSTYDQTFTVLLGFFRGGVRLRTVSARSITKDARQRKIHCDRLISDVPAIAHHRITG